MPDQPDSPQQPSKRRKTQEVAEAVHDDFDVPFVSLLGGAENPQSVKTRAFNFCETWEPKGKLIDVRLWNLMNSWFMENADLN